MKKILNSALIPFLIGSFSFSLNSCKTNDKWNVEIKDLKDTAGVKDYRIKYTDGSNFEFKKNKKSRYFVLTREALCYPEFNGYGSSLWRYGFKVQVYVPDDKNWDKVASFYGFNRNTSKESIKKIMNSDVFYVRMKFVLNIKEYPTKCVLTDLEKLKPWEPAD